MVEIGLVELLYRIQRKIVKRLAPLKAARLGLEQIRQSLAFQAVQGFYTVLFAGEQLKILSEQRDNL